MSASFQSNHPSDLQALRNAIASMRENSQLLDQYHRQLWSSLTGDHESDVNEMTILRKKFTLDRSWEETRARAYESARRVQQYNPQAIELAQLPQVDASRVVTSTAWHQLVQFYSNTLLDSVEQEMEALIQRLGTREGEIEDNYEFHDPDMTHVWETITLGAALMQEWDQALLISDDVVAKLNDSNPREAEIRDSRIRELGERMLVASTSWHGTVLHHVGHDTDVVEA